MLWLLVALGCGPYIEPGAAVLYEDGSEVLWCGPSAVNAQAHAPETEWDEAQWSVECYDGERLASWNEAESFAVMRVDGEPFDAETGFDWDPVTRTITGWAEGGPYLFTFDVVAEVH